MPASKAEQAAVAARRAQAIQLRIAKVDYQTIADRLGYSSRSAACQDVTRAFERNRLEEGRSVELLRDQEISALDRAQAAIWTRVTSGELAAVDTLIRLIARRCRILGLDAATEVRVFTLDAIQAEIMRLEAEMAARDQAGIEAETRAP